MKKISILALHLGSGGIERITTMLANNLCNDYKVEIVSTYKLFNKPFFNLDSRITVKYLIPDMVPNEKEFKAALADFRFIKAFKEGLKSLKILRLKKSTMINYIKKCDSDIIISTRDIFNTLLGRYGSKYTVKIGWEHNHHNNNKNYVRKIINSVSKFVLVSKELCDFYKDIVEPKCVYIPNCIDYYPEELSDMSLNRILSVGRLAPEKDPLELLEVFKLVNNKFPNWHLDIVGDGVLKDKIEDKIEELKLTDSVTLHGNRNRDYINALLAKTSIFVTTSKTESFGIVVLEAAAYGVPTVAYSRAQGVTEIISDEYDGFLIENTNREIMAKKIMELITDPNLCQEMGKNASKTAAKYKAEEISKMWIDIIEKKD